MQDSGRTSQVYQALSKVEFQFETFFRHELSHSITLLKWYLDEIQKKDQATMSEDGKKAVDILVSKLQEMQDLIAEMSVISRRETTMALKRDMPEFSLNLLVYEVIQSHGPEFISAGIEVTVTPDPFPNLKITNDHRIDSEQILEILLRNIVDKSPEATILNIEFRQEPEAGISLKVTVDSTLMNMEDIANIINYSKGRVECNDPGEFIVKF
jgi:signal transduction histidine kinase